MSQEKRERRFEAFVGLVIAIFTAVFTINNLITATYDDNELIYHGDKASALSWYNSKSIKENLAEGQVQLLQSFIASGTLDDTTATTITEKMEGTLKDIERYSKEKKEILVGSSNIPESEWAQDVGGELGKVIGAQEYEQLAEINAEAGDRANMATMFFELCLVFGGITLLFNTKRLERVFLAFTITFGLVGASFTLAAMMHVWPF